jgi:hypothetical protein
MEDHRGLGMRVLGRLAFAAALLVPVGVAVSAPAGASVGTASCSGNAGTAVASPGLLLTTYNPQSIALTATLSTCTGGFVTGGTLTAKFATPNVRCGTLIGKSDPGTAKFTWNAGDHAGTTSAKFNLKVATSGNHQTHGTFNGVVTTTGSNLFAGKAISGTIDLTKALTSVNAGGDCSVTHRLRTFPINSDPASIVVNIG